MIIAGLFSAMVFMIDHHQSTICQRDNRGGIAARRLSCGRLYDNMFDDGFCRSAKRNRSNRNKQNNI